MEPIIEFREVTIETRPPYDTGLDGVTFSLATGELLLVDTEKGHGHSPLVDAAEGLVEPAGGRVAFLGKAWAAMGPGEACAGRGRIGRVFESSGWMSNLNIDENITLSQRHHTLRPVEEIGQEAERLARSFGLPELPRVRPALLKRPERRVAEWVRAFLGDPLLIILEEPMNEAYNGAFDRLVGAVAAARARGAGVFWITGDQRTLTAPELRSARRFRLQGVKLEKL